MMTFEKMISALREALAEAFRISLVLFRVMIPAIIVVRVLGELGAVELLGSVLAPVMQTVGLPGQMGLVWATALLTNIYGGIAVFVSLLPDHPLSVAQVTVLASMILVAHSMIVELSIARKAGIRIRFLAPARILCAYLLGLLLHTAYSTLGILGRRANVIWEVSEGSGTLGGWAVGQLRNLLMIYLVVLGLVIVLKLLDRIGFTRILNRILEPVLTSMGIGESAAATTVVGIVLGISYGGGIIIRDARSGTMDPRDVFFSVTLMGLAHAVIEDTLLMASLGAHLSGILLGRLAFTWLVILVLVKGVRAMSDRAFQALLYREPARSPSRRSVEEA